MGQDKLITRRGLLKAASVLGCSAAAHPFMTPVSFAATPGDHRLVVIILRGGMDGLDLLRPIGDPMYRTLRPALSAGKDLDLNGFYALHPSASKLHELWQAGELSFAQAVSTPYRDKRSHFDGQDILEAGTAGIADAKDGWLNRLVQTMPDAQLRTALAVGREDMLILNGAAETSGWTPEARLSLSPATQHLMERVSQNDPLFSQSLAEAMELAEFLNPAAFDTEIDEEDMSMAASLKRARTGDRMENVASFAAQMLREDTRIASFSVTGWDNHVDQKNAFARALGNLETAIMTLRRDLGSVWKKTTVIAMTEFGRTAAQNGTQGTDHGTGGAALIAGGAIKGGLVHGDWPGLDEAALYNRRDLMPTADIRLYAAGAMASLFGVNRAEIEGTIFPGLDMSAGLPEITL